MARKEPALVGVFPYLDDLLKALAQVKRDGRKFEVFSPTHREEIKEALGKPTSPVRRYTLFGGISGLVSGVGLGVYTVLAYKFIVSGKPVIPWVAFVVIGFEFTILLGVLITLAGILIHAGLPKLRLPAHYDPRFSSDHFGIMVHYDDGEREGLAQMLQEAGAKEVHDVQE